MRRNALATLLLATALGGCSTGWFGGKEAPPLPGERLSVLALESELAADPRLADVPVELPPPVAVEAWSQAGGNPEHVVGHAALGGALRQAWSADIGDGAGSESRLLAQPVVVEGRVYALDSAGRLSARDAANGAELWRVAVVPREEDGEALGGGIAYANGRLYVTAGYAEVMAIDPANGGLIWTRKLPGPARAAPTAAGGRVFATTIDNQLTVVSAETGEVQWSHAGIVESAGLLGSASPAVRGNLVLVPYSSGELFALRLENGRPAWSETLAGRRRGGGLSQLVDIRGLPVIDNNLAFAISHGGTMAALDMRTGARAWDQDIGGIATPWVAGEF
ncbi:MAG TPA: PQQ-binding-like beta-propeller repeat protein, partial [Alphaproteobacteria bacterium]|nr:PQQ-binding-like beta-propeller repeat protein [Alphaproteobacteria bacterium]